MRSSEKRFRKQFLNREDEACRSAYRVALREAEVLQRRYRYQDQAPHDFAQDALVKLFVVLDSSKEVDNWKAYLKRIVKNSVLKHLERLRPTLSLQEEISPEVTNLAEERIQSLDFLWETVVKISKALIRQGKEVCAKMVMDQLQHRRSHAELAQIYNMTEASIRVKFHRCMELFKSAIAN